MIYLDNAATTYPKPLQVYRAWQRAMGAYGANPGRSGHKFSVDSAAAVFESRAKCAELFGAEPENTVFTLNCTHGLNMAIKGVARRGAHYVVSDLEHNAVIRPVHAAAEQYGGSYTIFETSDDEEETLWNAERAIRPDTVALVCTAASNVIGMRTPIKELASLCIRKSGRRSNRIYFIVDAAQGAGTLPLKMSDGINILCAAGHKGLYGPMGTGLMITDGSFPLKTIIEGGTGSASESLVQPEFMPDRFESGTINTAGVIALGAGVDFIMRRDRRQSAGMAGILSHELALCKRFCAGVRGMSGVTLYNDITSENEERYAPVVSFNIDGMPSVQTAAFLSDKGIYMRGGLHCAPLAHKKIGTLDGGTVRFSPSVFTSSGEVDAVIRILAGIKQ